MSNPSFRVIGLGRAGTSVHRALTKVGWTSVDDGEDVLFITTPDALIAQVAASVAVRDDRPVVHLSGSLGLDVLAPHPRRASVHPMMALPDAATGSRRLLNDATFALNVAGDPIGVAVVDAFGGRAITLADDAEVRARHHAACCVASNYVTTVLGLVERVAANAGAPIDAYLDLARGAIDNVGDVGAAASSHGSGGARRSRNGGSPPQRSIAAPRTPRFHEALIVRHRGVGRDASNRHHRGVSQGARLRARARAGPSAWFPRWVRCTPVTRVSSTPRGPRPTSWRVTVFVNPLAVRSQRRPHQVPAPVRGRRGAGRPSTARTTSSTRRSRRCTATGDRARRIHVAERHRRDGRRGASRPLRRRRHCRGQAVQRRRACPARSSARRITNSSRSCGRWSHDLSFPIEIVAVPDRSGGRRARAVELRNVYLSPEDRAAATVLHRALQTGARRRRPTPQQIITDIVNGRTSSDASITPRPSSPNRNPSTRRRQIRHDPTSRQHRSSPLMRRHMMKSKIHRATVTDANLNYVGSISLDPRLMELADILEWEQVAISTSTTAPASRPTRSSATRVRSRSTAPRPASCIPATR